MRRKQKTYFNEFTVLGVFVAVAVLGFLYAGMSLIMGQLVPPSQVMADVVVAEQAPTLAEYQAEARSVLGAFLDEARTMTVDDVEAADGSFLQDVKGTQAKLLAMRVPGEMRDAHLAFVLVLDQWKRAIDGSAADQRVVVARTNDLITANPWLQATSETL